MLLKAAKKPKSVMIQGCIDPLKELKNHEKLLIDQVHAFSMKEYFWSSIETFLGFS